MVYTAVVVDSLPPKVSVVVTVLHDDPHPSQSMNHMFSLVANHMPNSIFLHFPPIYIKKSISWLVLTPFSTCSCTLHVGSHKIDIYDTMVHCYNLMGLALLKLDNFRNWGSYLWCIHLHDTECTKGRYDLPYPSWYLVVGVSYWPTVLESSSSQPLFLLLVIILISSRFPKPRYASQYFAALAVFWYVGQVRWWTIPCAKRRLCWSWLEPSIP